VKLTLTPAAAALIVLTALQSWSCASSVTSGPGAATENSVRMSSPPSATTQPGSRPWTIRDIVEVSRIVGVAIRGTTDATAYIVKRPSIADGTDHYRLCVVDLGHKGHPRELLEARYLADISWRPGTQNWSVRADFGSGVQLYDVTDDGHPIPLVSTPTTELVGGSDGLVMDPTEAPRQVGVLSYEWSPDGTRLWYSRLRFRDAAAQLRLTDQGLRYDDSRMFTITDRDLVRSIQLLGTELRVFDPESRSDRLIAFAPADAIGGSDAEVFRRRSGNAVWVGPSHIQYRGHSGSAGYLSSSMYRVNIDTGETVRLTTQSPDQIFDSAPTREGILTVGSIGQNRHLVNLSVTGRVLSDYGPATFPRVSGSLGAWQDRRGRRVILGVHFDNRDGLVAVTPGARTSSLRSLSIQDHLSGCAFNLDVSFGACSRESNVVAPQLVSIRPPAGNIEILANPNSAYEEIAPLRTVEEHWVNRFDYSNTGYITYPRHYLAGRTYPAIVITHWLDAKNRFAWDGFQWEFPLQEFAERDYFVLSVNEPSRRNDVPLPDSPGASGATVQQQQFHEGYNPLASMEAAAQALIARGMVDRSMIGIAGYSRGASIARFAISHSKLFSAASSGDANWWDVGGFWEGGAFSRNLYRNLFGGDPFDPGTFQAYLDFSASARTRSFAGPLLQQWTSADAHHAVEMDQLLKSARIPTELYIFPSEAHLFWQPRHRAAAMEQNLDWFDFWLAGRRDPNPQKAKQYEHWEAMAAEWRLAVAPRESNAPLGIGVEGHN
jgi:dipeptidyl aminopeptidase/acylaminoacyl peptidase